MNKWHITNITTLTAAPTIDENQQNFGLKMLMLNLNTWQNKNLFDSIINFANQTNITNAQELMNRYFYSTPEITKLINYIDRAFVSKDKKAFFQDIS
jgi:vacuolar-type H+-ATPase subunit C/Vma6